MTMVRSYSAVVGAFVLLALDGCGSNQSDNTTLESGLGDASTSIDTVVGTAPDASMAGSGEMDASASLDTVACTWSASLNPLDASVDGQCIAARTFLTCEHANCISDDLTQCSNPLVTSEGTCENRCSSAEYGIQCGKVGPSTWQTPDGCRLITALPAGIGFYCCSCGP